MNGLPPGVSSIIRAMSRAATTLFDAGVEVPVWL
jgi:hypothetical protein